MGQVSTPPSIGWTVLPVDRESGPGAGGGNTGNATVMIGLNAGLNNGAANTIVIGNSSGGGGIPTANPGNTIVGQGSLNKWNAQASGLAFPGVTAIGHGIGPNIVGIDTTVLIGDGVLPLYVSTLDRSVFIGNGSGGNWNASATGSSNNVVIGYEALNLSGATGGGMNSCVIIGSQACNSPLVNVPTNSIIIGFQAGGQGSGCSNATIIGSQSSDNGNGSNNTFLGNAITWSTAGSAANTIVGWGGGSPSGLGSQNTLIGAQARAPQNVSNVRSICLGSSAGRTLANTSTNILCIETNDSSDAQRAAIYSTLLNGNIVLGNSTDASNRDFGTTPGTNMLKLLNGTKHTGTNPSGGGYFYVSGGLLHWVDTAGNDLNISGASATGASTASFVATNKPGATTGAGPATWLPVTVGGTSFQLPLWAT